MKHKLLLFSLLLSTAKAGAQNMATFEEVSLGTGGYYNGSDLSGGFSSGNLFFRNRFDTQFSSWSGFAVSDRNDTLTAGFSNQYSCYAGSGSGGSARFGLAYIFGPAVMKTGTGVPFRITSFRYSNTTYAALSMKNGDAFCKKFGGPGGNDPDFFGIRVYNHYQGQVNDSTDVYLADYRFADNTQDYIVKAWRTASLNFSTPADSLSFILQSSDNGTFGMNTPAYFCIDNVEYQSPVSAETRISASLPAFPNPFRKSFRIQMKPGHNFEIFDAQGKSTPFVMRENAEGAEIEIPGKETGLFFGRFGNGAVLRMVKE